MDLATPVTYLKGVGPLRAEQLEAKGLATAADLLLYAPFRYEDRTRVIPIADLAPGEMASVLATVHSVAESKLRRRNLGLMEVLFRDETGGRLLGKWFHAASYLGRILEPGVRVALYGKVEFDTYSRQLSMMHPDYELLRSGGVDEDDDETLHMGRIVPVYEAVGKVTTRTFRVILKRLLDRVTGLADTLPAEIRARLGLPELELAIRELHFPSAGHRPAAAE